MIERENDRFHTTGHRTLGLFWCALLTIAQLTPACDEGGGGQKQPEPTPMPNVMPSGDGFGYLIPPAGFPGGTVWVEAMSTMAVTFVAPLEGESLFYIDAAGMWRMNQGVSTSIDEDGVLAEAQINAVSRLPLGGSVLATDVGLYVLDDHTVARSPITLQLWGEAVHDVMAAPILDADGDVVGDQVWLTTDDGLFVWQDDELLAMEPENLPTTGVSMVYGAPVDGVPAVWVGTPDAFYALVQVDGEFVAYTVRDDLGADAFAVDGEGSLWVLDGGTLHQRNTDGEWARLAFDGLIAGLESSPTAEGLWFWTDAGTLWHLTGDDLREIPYTSTLDTSAIDSQGRLVTSDAEGMHRLHPGLTVSMEGLRHMQYLEAPVDLQLRPTFPDFVDGIEAHLDGTPVAVSPDGAVTLDPFALAMGGHELVVSIDYAGDTPEIVVALRFIVGDLSVTWSEDVEPLFQERCEQCHNGGTTLPLELKEEWQNDIDQILFMVEGGSMPIGSDPLTFAQIERIRLWRDGGFLE